MAESPKYFFKHMLKRGPYGKALAFLRANPNLGAWPGFV
jgi:hypothetical protein